MPESKSKHVVISTWNIRGQRDLIIPTGLDCLMYDLEQFPDKEVQSKLNRAHRGCTHCECNHCNESSDRDSETESLT